MHHDHGQQGATAPLTLMSAVSSGDEQHHVDDEAGAALAGPVDELLAGPGGHPRRVECLR